MALVHELIAYFKGRSAQDVEKRLGKRDVTAAVLIKIVEEIGPEMVNHGASMKKADLIEVILGTLDIYKVAGVTPTSSKVSGDDFENFEDLETTAELRALYVKAVGRLQALGVKIALDKTNTKALLKKKLRDIVDRIKKIEASKSPGSSPASKPSSPASPASKPSSPASKLPSPISVKPETKLAVVPIAGQRVVGLPDAVKKLTGTEFLTGKPNLEQSVMDADLLTGEIMKAINECLKA